MSSLLIAGGAVAATDAPDDYLKFEDVKDASMRSEAIKTFNDYLKEVHPHAKVRQCSILLWTQPGKVETIFGGMCELQKGHKVAICGDTGVGEFALSEYFSPTKDGIAKFVRKNCPGG